MVDNTKICKKCGLPKACSDFTERSVASGGGISPVCKHCIAKKAKIWTAANRDRCYENHKRWRNSNKKHLRNTWLRFRYGITVEQYEAMFERQGGLCALCGKREIAKDKRSGKILSLAVDHDHVSKVVRDLLCLRCNKALGMFAENIELLLAAISYLTKHRGSNAQAS